MSEYNMQDIAIAKPFRKFLYKESLLFQVTDLLPIPVGIFYPDGTSAFVNTAFLQCFHIEDASLLVGKLNVLQDAYLHSKPAVSEYIKRIFAGEILTLQDVKVPFEEIADRYFSDKGKQPPSGIYQDIIGFPILDENASIAYVITIFKTRHVYKEQLGVLKAKAFIQAHWFEDFSINMVAAEAGFSSQYLTRLFKKHEKMTPYGYYQNIKVEKIKEALCDMNISIAQAFSACGSDYSSSISKVFKAKTGMTPSQYRQKILAGKSAAQALEAREETNERDGETGFYAASSYLDTKDEELLFQIVDMFPIPMQIFKPNGDIVCINQAVLYMWNISDSSQILGKYNLLNDPYINEQLNMKELIQRIFKGETVLIPDIKVPLEDFWRWYKTGSLTYGIEAIYTDIYNFPVTSHKGEIIYIVSIFFTNRIYRCKSNIERAKEYIENHWIEKFDLDKVSGSVNLSRYHFARLFRKHTGMTPFGYYQQIKINKLKEALRDKNLTVSEAFANCGITYHGNFAKFFKQRTGMTPTQYRKVT